MKTLKLLLSALILIAGPGFTTTLRAEVKEVKLIKPQNPSFGHHAPAFIPIEAYVDLSTNTLYLVSDTIEDVAEVVITDVTTNFESTYSVTISNVPEPVLLPCAYEIEITITLSGGQVYYGELELEGDLL